MAKKYGGVQGSCSGLDGMGGARLAGGSGGGLGVFSMTPRATSSADIGVPHVSSYPRVDRMESSRRSSTAPTPDTLSGRKA